MGTWVASVAATASVLVGAHVAWRVLRRRGVLRRWADRWLPRIRRRAVALPRPLRAPLLFVTDRLFPSWRTYAGGTGRDPTQSDQRILQVRAAGRRTPVVLLGGVYLDITLRHIDVDKLLPGELSTLSPVMTRAGGSGVHVGRRLYARFNRPSTLITRLGGGAGTGDSFSGQLRRLLAQEPWHRSLRSCSSAPGEQCGVSVHLEQREQAWRTTFTYPGSLRSLGWQRGVRRTIQKRTRAGGVLYVSGFFRTNLFQDLRENLSYLSPRVLVCLDHGEFQPEDNAEAVRRLGDAFGSGHVDLYVCTLSELRSLCQALFIPVFECTRPEEMLLRLHEQGHAPPVVILRGGLPSGLAAMVMHHGDITPVDELLPGTQRLYGSAFTADFLGHLLSSTAVPPDTSATDVIVDSVVRACEPWSPAV